ncbi:MAG: ATP-binding protein, partial [Acidobacteriota bacterium]
MTKRSIRGALRSIVTSTTTCALLLACGAFVGADILESRRTLERDLTMLASVIASNSAASLMFGDSESGSIILSALRAKPSVVSACIYSRAGTAFAVYPHRPGNRGRPPSRAPRPGMRFTARDIEITQRIVFDGETIGTLFIASDMSDVVATMKRYMMAAGAILLGSLLVALAVSSRLQRILTDPILHLARVADRVRHGKDYSLRATVAGKSSPNEIALLTSAFDDMIAEIQQRDDELQRRRGDLEEQVERRTTELRVANVDLVGARDEAQRIADLNERLSLHKKTILDTAAEGLFELDENGVATFINRSAASMLGYSVEELSGRTLHDIIHPDDVRSLPVTACKVCSARLGASLRSGSAFSFVSRGGTTFPVEFTTSTMPGEGTPGVVVTFRDITERLAIERMKDEFVSTVSHELRTPLTSIRGALGLLRSGLVGNISERATRMLDIAVTNTDRLVRLINDILDLERISSGGVELHRKWTTATELMAAAVDVVQAEADRSGVSISRQDDHTALWVDSDRVVQTLTNLLGNAVKFSPSGSMVRVSGQMKGNGFTFSVSDTGRGIPAEKLESIFERFKQVDASDSRDKGGSGLGLAICRSIVTAHGGRIWAESREGDGATFSFTIPMKNVISAT